MYFAWQTTEKDDASDVSLYVVDPETNQFIKKVELDGTEIPLDAQNTYTITFDTNGGTSSDNELITDASGKLSSLPTATRDDYTFDGWFTAAEGGEEVTVDTIFTENTTVYAHWTKSTIPPTDEKTVYEITFDANGGTSTNSELSTDADGKLSSLPTAVRTNYVFDGWFTSVSGGAKITTDTVFTENTTVYAHWTNSGNSSGSTGGTSSDSTSSNETSSDSPDSTPTNSSSDESSDSNSDMSSDSSDSSSSNGMSSTSDGTYDSDPFSVSGESSNNSNGSSSDDSGNPSNNPQTGVSVAFIPLLFVASASMVIFHKRGKK